jgi:hypothetical protein
MFTVGDKRFQHKAKIWRKSVPCVTPLFVGPVQNRMWSLTRIPYWHFGICGSREKRVISCNYLGDVGTMMVRTWVPSKRALGSEGGNNCVPVDWWYYYYYIRLRHMQVSNTLSNVAMNSSRVEMITLEERNNWWLVITTVGEGERM